MNNRALLPRIALAATLSNFAPTVLAHGAEELGQVTFPTSCDPKVQATFERGVAALHSYWFPEATKTFDAVLKDDPGCAMALWGKAVVLLDNSLAFPPPAKNLAEAAAVLEKARSMAVRTERERDWLEAIGAYYRDHDKVPLDKRLAAYTQALERMTQRYPTDDEAWIFYALMLQSSAPKDDRTYANQLKSAGILERMVDKYPQHPGAAHYLIHAYDFPPLAEKGLPAARKYAGIAPAAPHARHMPSHIYSMVGLWEESIVSNRSALDARPDYYHAMDFMTYAYLQLGQDAKARAMVDEMRKVVGDKPVTQNYTAVACIPARVPLERGDWAAAAALPVTDLKQAHADSLTRFARGLGMARGRDLAGARSEVEALKALKQSLDKTSAYWAARTEEQIFAVSAWIARGEGDDQRAETLMRAAADGEDASVKNVQMENRLYPLRELYADLLLEIGRPAEALRNYQSSLKETPNRYRGFYGAALAAQAAGDKAAAKKYFEALVALGKNADSPRPEIARARDYLAQK
jgi:tetratricopeptide (TPR) repeat protein